MQGREQPQPGTRLGSKIHHRLPAFRSKILQIVFFLIFLSPNRKGKRLEGTEAGFGRATGLCRAELRAQRQGSRHPPCRLRAKQQHFDKKCRSPALPAHPGTLREGLSALPVCKHFLPGKAAPARAESSQMGELHVGLGCAPELLLRKRTDPAPSG